VTNDDHYSDWGALPVTDGDHIDCPFCGTRLVWADALIFGCTGDDCPAEFYEEDVPEVVWSPLNFIPEPPEEG